MLTGKVWGVDVGQTESTDVATIVKKEWYIHYFEHTHTHTYRNKSSVHVCLHKVGMVCQASHKLFVSFQSSNLKKPHSSSEVGITEQRASPDTALDNSVVSSEHFLCLCPTQSTWIPLNHNNQWQRLLIVERIVNRFPIIVHKLVREGVLVDVQYFLW